MKSSPNRPLQSFAQLIMLVGVILILLGVAAIVLAVVSPQFIGLLLASFFLVAGAIRFVYSWQTRTEPGFGLKVSTAALSFIASLVLLTALLQAYFSLTKVVGGILILQGLLELGLVKNLPRSSTRQWFLGTSLGALLLGGLFVSNLVLGTAWLLGLVAALTLIGPGGWLIFIAYNMQADTAAKQRSRHRQ